MEVQPQDHFLILACDGIFDVMTSQDACNYVQRRLLLYADVQRARYVQWFFGRNLPSESRVHMTAHHLCHLYELQ